MAKIETTPQVKEFIGYTDSLADFVSPVKVAAMQAAAAAWHKAGVNALTAGDTESAKLCQSYSRYYNALARHFHDNILMLHKLCRTEQQLHFPSCASPLTNSISSTPQNIEKKEI